jgi:dihydroneopterin triphosphate diphosphatase
MTSIRCDLVDVYVVRQYETEWVHRVDPVLELLQLHRSEEAKALRGTYQPVMGHIEKGETAVDAAIREVNEELGLSIRDAGFRGLWQLEQVHPFFLAGADAVVMSPRFVTEVSLDWEPRLNGEHDGFRWVPAHQEMRFFMWPGQLNAVREIVDVVFRPGSITHEALRVR